jgi:hypothetical protein
MSLSKHWTTVTESQHPWEGEALSFDYDRLPKHESHRALANLERPHEPD